MSLAVAHRVVSEQIAQGNCAERADVHAAWKPDGDELCRWALTADGQLSWGHTSPVLASSRALVQKPGANFGRLNTGQEEFEVAKPRFGQYGRFVNPAKHPAQLMPAHLMYLAADPERASDFSTGGRRLAAEVLVSYHLALALAPGQPDYYTDAVVGYTLTEDAIRLAGTNLRAHRDPDIPPRPRPDDTAAETNYTLPPEVLDLLLSGSETDAEGVLTSVAEQRLSRTLLQFATNSF